MRRRDLLSLVGRAAVSWPLAARAQQPPLPVVGFLTSYALDEAGNRLAAAFREGLKEAGYDDGRNVRIDYSSAQGDYARLPALAADLVARRVAVIAAVGGSPAALAAKAASASVPIVFVIGVDPTQYGLVASLNRPGANVTGIVNMALEVSAKRIELLRELLPNRSKIAFLVNPSAPSAAAQIRQMEAAAQNLGFKLHVVNATREAEFDGAFARSTQVGASGVVIAGDPFFNTRAEQLAGLALRYSLPAAYQFREFAAAGGLVSYGTSQIDAHKEAGIYTGRVLKGEKPADLPVQQSTKVELIINMKTAKAFGITVPITLLGRADEVIE